ncbi:hypothetical protein V498_07449 [Pseudogymnoascus sp. VKM F-4517 (FW-2822)]|nr:hypothetical protein V498_07449 [Pseudogymnoascus sp. VKM F-4517 (FW-2822)]
MARLFITQIFLALPVIVSTNSLSRRQSCGASYYCSSTSGDSSGSGGASGADWISNAAGITGMINGGSYIARSLHSRQEDALCCPSGTECGVLDGDNVPVCYDPQTTMFTFADGSYGYTNTGNYYDTEGNVFNLDTGDYTLADGTLGNLFVDNGEVPPATATNTGVVNSVSIPSATDTAITNSVSIPSATDTAITNSVSIPSATDTAIINSEPIPTGTVDRQTKPSEGSSASLRGGYGDVIMGVVGGLALGIVL